MIGNDYSIHEQLRSSMIGGLANLIEKRKRKRRRVSSPFKTHLSIDMLSPDNKGIIGGAYLPTYISIDFDRLKTTPPLSNRSPENLFKSIQPNNLGEGSFTENSKEYFTEDDEYINL